MKKISILFLSTIAFISVLTSCTDDIDSTAERRAAIEGKWNFDTYTVTSGGTTGEVMDAAHGCTGRESINFKMSDETFELNILDSECTSLKFEGNCTLKKDVITMLDTDNNLNKYTVVSVTASNLVLKKFDVEGVNENYTTHYLSR